MIDYDKFRWVIPKHNYITYKTYEVLLYGNVEIASWALLQRRVVNNFSTELV